jgi:ribosomal protein L9
MVPEHVFGDLLRLDTEMLSIQELMKKPMSVEAFKGLQVELLRAQTKLAELKQTFASFETRAGAFSGVYGSTSKEDMLNMNPTEFLQYSQGAMALQAHMEQLNKTPLVNTNGTITNDAEKILIQIRELMQEQNKEAKLMAEKLQRNGTRQKSDMDSVDNASAETLVAKIAEAVPALSDFKAELMKFSMTDLKYMGKEATYVTQDMRNKTMGLTGSEPMLDASAAKTAVDNITSTISNRDFNIILEGMLSKAGMNVEANSLNLVSGYNKQVLYAMSEGLVKSQAAVSKIADSKQRIAAQKLVNAKAEALEEAFIAATYDVAKIASEAGKAFASSVKESMKTALMSLTSGDFDGTLKTMLNSFVSNVQSTFIDGFMEPLFGEKSPLMAKIKALGSNIFAQGYDLNGFGEELSSKDIDPNQTVFSSSVGTFRDAVNALITSVGGTPIPTQGSGFNANSYSNARVMSPVGSGGINSTDISKDANGNDIVSATDQSASTISESVSSSNASLGGTFTNAIGGSTTQLLGGFMMVGGLLTTIASGLGGNGGKVNWLGIAIGAVTTAVGAYASLSTPTPAATIGSSFTGSNFSYDIAKRANGGVVFDGNGGLLHGAGHGTSDSINAMLSNGEYVVNAESTKKFFPLIQAINSGKLPAFAEGGLIGASPTPTSVDLIKPVAGDTGSTQHFTISVTGDVSRQTRMEIQKMIPNIAIGVNSFNREKGNR